MGVDEAVLRGAEMANDELAVELTSTRRPSRARLVQRRDIHNTTEKGRGGCRRRLREGEGLKVGVGGQQAEEDGGQLVLVRLAPRTRTRATEANADSQSTAVAYRSTKAGH